MPASLVDADSLLAIDVGTITTRAALFDVVESNYRFVAAGQSPSTAAAPFKDISEGIRQAIENLQAVTGRVLLGENHRLIIPAQDGSGIDTVAATISAGPAIRTVVIGLLNDVSVESAQRLVRSNYCRVLDTIGLNDKRKLEEQVDAVVRLGPDLVLVAGGTDSGATRSVQRMVEMVGLACYLLPAEKRPALLFAGNQSLVEEVKNSLQELTASITISPNLRPQIGVENLEPAQRILAELSNQIRRGQMSGVDELNAWSANTLVPTAYAEGRIVRFLSQGYDPSKGILGVDIGASAVTVAAAFNGALTLGVYPQLGLGEGLSQLLRYTTLDEIVNWIPFEIAPEVVRDYVFQKSIYPASLPAIPEDLAIEQALARQTLHVALGSAARDFPRRSRRAAAGLMPYFEPILACGSAITRAPTIGQSLHILLDAIQPVGITTVILDQNNLLPALGAAASRNPILPVHVLESGAFLLLATVVAPYAAVRAGTPVLQVRLIDQNGAETRLDVRQGGLEALPLPPGQAGRLYLHPLHHANIGFGPGRAPRDGIPVNGTAMGIVIDARGRPLRLPAEPNRRREAIKKWQWTLGG
jgi:hypothetical protein